MLHCGKSDESFFNYYLQKEESHKIKAFTKWHRLQVGELQQSGSNLQVLDADEIWRKLVVS